MNRTTLLSVFVASLALAGCSATPEPTPTVTATVESVVTVTTTATPEPLPAVTVTAEPVANTPAEPMSQTMLLIELGQIDERLSDERSAGRVENMCSSIVADAEGTGGTYSLEELVRLRFYEDLTDTQVADILGIIEASGWCE